MSGVVYNDEERAERRARFVNGLTLTPDNIIVAIRETLVSDVLISVGAWTRWSSSDRCGCLLMDGLAHKATDQWDAVDQSQDSETVGEVLARFYGTDEDNIEVLREHLAFAWDDFVRSHKGYTFADEFYVSDAGRKATLALVDAEIAGRLLVRGA